MESALRSKAMDVVGLGRIFAIEPDAPSRLLRGEETRRQVRPPSTGIKYLDGMGSLAVTW